MSSQRRTFQRPSYPAVSGPVLPLRVVEPMGRDWRTPYARWAGGPLGGGHPGRDLDGFAGAAYNGRDMSEAPAGNPPNSETENVIAEPLDTSSEPASVEPLAEASEAAAAAEPAPPEPPPAAPERKEKGRARAKAFQRNAGRPALIQAVFVPIEELEPDDTFQLREPGDVAGLATSMARVGQLFPIDVRPRGGSYQVIAGFRRLAALKFLQRDRVLARVHDGMSDAEAWVYALAQALETRGLSVEEITAIRERLEQSGQLTPQARGLIDAALTVPGSDLEPEAVDAPAAVEVDLDELSRDLHERLNGISQDVQLVISEWQELEPEVRAALLDQLRYYGELHAYLARLR